MRRTPAPIIERAVGNDNAGRPSRLQNEVERGGEIGRGIDQRPVEVEHDHGRGGGHHGGSVTFLPPDMQGRSTDLQDAGLPAARKRLIALFLTAG